MPDQTSADLRFSTLMAIVAEKHDVCFLAIGEKRQIAGIGEEHMARYCRLLQSGGVSIVNGGIAKVLESRPYCGNYFRMLFHRDEVDRRGPDIAGQSSRPH